MLFSVIVPTYNYAEFLPECLRSVLQQQYQDYEVIVVDDGSTDNTPAVLTQIAPAFGSRLQVIRQDNAGPGAARNRGIAAAAGEFVLFLDADDQLTHDALLQFRHALSKNRRAELIIGGHISNDAGKLKPFKGSLLSASGKQNLQDYLRKKITLCNGAMLMAKSLFSQIRFPENLRLCEDIPVFAQTLAIANSMAIETPVVTIRKHNGSRRHDVDALLESVDTLPGLVFNADVVPPDCYALKREFSGRMYLRAFRSLYQCQRYREARRFYLRAIKTYPRLLFLGNYLRKFIKSFMHWRQTPPPPVI